MKVIALKPEESETLERAFYEADSYERLISVLGRNLNAEASADAKDIIMLCGTVPRISDEAQNGAE